MKLSLYLLILVTVFCCAAFCAAENFVLGNPSGSFAVGIGTGDDGRLFYRIDKGGVEVAGDSELGISIDGNDLGDGVVIGTAVTGEIDETFPARGAHAEGRHRCNTATIPISHIESGVTYSLETRACEDGFAYRYVVPGSGKRIVNGELSSWNLPRGGTYWYQTDVKNYEGEYSVHRAVEKDTRVGPPLTYRLPDGAGYVAISEGALFNYSGMTLIAKEENYLVAEFLDDPEGWEIDGDVVSPWRVTIIADNLNGLVNADIIAGVNEPPSESFDGADWIRPGKSLWSWLNGGRSIITPAKMREYVDAASKLGFEYVLVDDGWEDSPPVWKPMKGWSEPGKTAMDIMSELVQYAEKKNVKIWVWKHFHFLADPEYRREYFTSLMNIGVVGVKIDFMDSESIKLVRFYEDCLRDAAKSRLMIDFHGANKPTGESRKWPNEMTREAVRGLEYNFTSPAHITALPFTRFVAGHADYTPVNFKRLRMSSSTKAFQLASGIILSSPVLFFGGDPNDFLESKARDLLEKMPTVWDETIVLDVSEPGELAAFARRSGDAWFIAVMNAGAKRKIMVHLDFLDEGSYALTAYFDDKRSPLLIKKLMKEVDRTVTIPIRMRSTGGFTATLEKITD